MKLSSLARLLAILLASVLARGQTVPDANQTGFPVFGTFHGSDVDSVSLQNGNLHIEIPIASFPERKGQFAYKFIYDTPSYTLTYSQDPAGVVWDADIAQDEVVGRGVGWRMTNSLNWYLNYQTNFLSCTVNDPFIGPYQVGYTVNDHYEVVDPDGGKHPLAMRYAGTNADQCGAAGAQLSGLTLDGTGTFVQMTPSTSSWNGFTVAATVKDGTQVVNGYCCTGWRDSNGNTASTSSDMLGRNNMVTTNGSAFTLYTVTDSNGNAQNFRVDWISVNVTSNFCSLRNGKRGGAAPCFEYNNTWQVPSRLTLPDGLYYQFTWNTDGTLQQMNLPTGGSVTYSYVSMRFNGVYSGAGCVKTDPNCVPTTTYPVRQTVTSRAVTVNGTTATWNYAGYPGGTTGSGLPPGGTTVTDPLQNQQVHTFGCCSNTQSYETQVKYYQGSSSTGTLLRTVNKDYGVDPSPLTLAEVINVRPIRETTILENGQTRETETDYETSTATCYACSQLSTYTITWLNPTNVREYDWGNGTPGPLMRTTSSTYLHAANANYLNANIADRPTSMTVYDGNGSTVAQTTFAYDGFSLTPTSGATGHDYTNYSSAYNLRGNLTQTSRWLNTSNTWVSTTNTYDDLGNLRSTTDANGNTTSLSYSDSWANSNCVPAGVNTQAYVTQISNALGQKTQTAYFPCTGLKQAVQNQNDINAGRAGTTFTYDGMNRPVSSGFPDGGSVTYDYSVNHTTAPPLWASSSTLIGGSLSTTRISVLDDLGRIQQHKSSVPTAQCSSGYTYQDLTYDALGRPATISNPYCTTSDPTYGVTTNAYDALGRVIQTTKQDSSITTAQYDQTSPNSSDGNCNTATDEAGKSRKSCSDALGRLIEVDEPQASTGSLSNPYVTLYSYDTLGNLLSVNQKGDGSQAARVRTFTYDSLSRLLSASNPESGTINYAYDADGNMLSKTSPAPNQTGSATQTISYCYDTLNRVTGKAYSAQSCPLTSPVVTLTYDAGTNGVGHLTSLTDPAGSGSYSYDALGRISAESRTINPGTGFNAVTKSLSYTYNLDGSVATLKYPSGAVVTYTPDAAGRAVSAVDVGNNINYVTGSGGPSSGATYAADGSMLSFNQGWTTNFAGIANSFAYNPRLQPVNMAGVSPGTTGTGASASVTVSGTIASGQSSVPPAAASNTGLTSLVTPDGNTHVAYVGNNQHLYHLYWTSASGWRGQDMTALTGGALVGSGSGLTSANGSAGPHIFYVDVNQHISDTFSGSGGNWATEDLTHDGGGPLAAVATPITAPGASNDALAQVYYVDVNRHLNRLYWPRSGGLTNQDMKALTGGPAVGSGSSLSSIVNPSYGGPHTYYEDSNQHINDTFQGGGGSWGTEDMTRDSGGPVAAVATPLVALWASNDALAQTYYVDANRHVNRLYWPKTGGFTNQDMTALTAGSLVGSGSGMSGYVAGYGGPGVHFIAADQHVHMVGQGTGGGWGDQDLTSFASGSPAAGSPMSSLLGGGDGAAHIFYVDTNRHINRLYWPTSGSFHNQDVTGAANMVQDSGTVSLSLGSGFTATACFGASTNSSCTGQSPNNTAAQVATALANSINVSASPATATVNGATINMTWKAAGPFTTPVSALSTTHDNPSLFANPSFTSTGTNFSGGTGANLAVFNINYDFHLGNGDNGNVYGITNYRDQNRNQSFTYDALNRLTSAQNAGTDCSKMTVNGATEYWGNNYGYDAWGNLLQKTPTKCSAENLSVTVLTNNQLVGYGYDAAGNMTHDATTGNNYSYDQENRITGAVGYTYTYDADGNRVEKSNGSTGTIYWYMSPGIVAESDLSGNLKSEYVFFGGERVARKDFSGGTTSVSYYFSDHLKTAAVVTDSAGNIKEDEDYYPWGGELQFLNNDPNHYKFTGKERDNESGLDYFGARYYANWLGRFVTPDKPFGDQHPRDPQSWNLYTYTLNNPLRFIDDTGQSTKPAESKFINDALATDPTLRNVILRSNNFSPAGFEGAFKSGALSNLDTGPGNTLRGLAGEAQVINEINADVRDPGAAFPQPTKLPGVSPDIGWTLGPGMNRFVLPNVANAAGGTSDVGMAPGTTEMYMEVKSGLSASSISSGVDQAVKTANAIGKAGLSAVSVLVVDAGAWNKLSSTQQAQLVSKAQAGGAFIQVQPGLADAARKRAQQLVDAAKKKQQDQQH